MLVSASEAVLSDEARLLADFCGWSGLGTSASSDGALAKALVGVFSSETL